MKPKPSLRLFLSIAGNSLLAISFASAATLYWDGGTVNIAGDGDSAASGLTGDWSTALLNWDAGPVPYVGWNNSNNDIAFFHRGTAIPGPNPGTVSLTSNITVGGIVFNASTYNISTGTNALTFGGTNNTVFLNNRATAAIINGNIAASAANMVFSAQNPLANHTLTFTGANSTGWSGTTTVNAGLTLATTSTSGNINQTLNSTSGITLNGGTLQFNRATNAALDAISDTAAITINGGGTFATTSADAGGASANETIGVVTLNSGQMNFNWTNNPSSGSVIILSGLNRSGSTSAITISQGNNGRFRDASISTDTAANEIIGPWATIGGQNGINAQTDYAIHGNGNGTFLARNIAASDQSTWSTTHAATSNYTMGIAGAPGQTLGGARNINTLRHGVAGAATANSSTEYLTLAGNTFSNGDIVGASGTAGLTAGTQYYVINKDGAGAGTFQLSTSPGGTAVNLTNTTAGQIAGAFSLGGFNLGTYGILNGTAAPLIINGGGGVITLPKTDAGNLFVTAGAGAISLNAPIQNNTGALTLVKNGSNDLFLAGNNTYTGGTVVNSGSLVFSGTNTFSAGDTINGGSITYSTHAAWGGAGRNVTFNGTGTLTSTVVGYVGGTLTSNAGANAVIASTSNGSNGSTQIAFATTTGAGNVIYSAGNNRLLNLGDASGLTGNLQARLTGNANFGTNIGIQFSSIADAAGSAIQFAGGTSDGNQAMTVAYNGSSALVFNNRQIQMLDRLTSNWEIRDNIIANNSSNAAHTWTINTDLLYTGGSAITAFGGSLQTGRRFILSGSNAGDNAFNGVIGDGQNSNGLNLYKEGAGKWILGGENTYTGVTAVTAGNLTIGGTLGHVSTGVGNYAANISIASTNSGKLVYDSSASQTLAGVISGAGALFVEDGTLTLTNDNTYTGATTVNGGELVIDGSTSSTSLVTVNSSGALGGSGTVGAATTIHGSLKPGNSAGELAFGNSLTLQNGAATTMEIVGLNMVRGVDYDGVDVTGSMTYGGSLILDFGTLFGAGNYTFNLFDFGSLTEDASFASVTLAGLYSGTLVNDSGVWGLTNGDNIWTFTESTGDLNLAVIPEPRAALLGAIGLLLLLRRRR